jgi:hypothetical protein
MHHHHSGTFVRFGLLSIYAICSSGLSAIGHQHFPLRTNQKNQPTIILSHNKLAPAASHRLMISISISTPKKCEEEKKNGR